MTVGACHSVRETSMPWIHWIETSNYKDLAAPIVDWTSPYLMMYSNSSIGQAIFSGCPKLSSIVPGSTDRSVIRVN
jgi:hypothetical protein